MERLQGRYSWFNYDGERRLKRVPRGSPAHLKATLSGSQVILCSPDTAEEDFRTYGSPMPPDGRWLEEQGIKFSFRGSSIVLAARDFSKVLDRYLLSE